MSPTTTKGTGVGLPPDVLASDTQYPKAPKGKYIRVDHYLTFYNTQGFGWCLATLEIAKGRRGNADRTYAARLKDGALLRVGQGPHVLSTVRVLVHKGNVARLQKYVDLYNSGLAKAGQVRDRISSRRAEGALMRSQGRTSWRWTV